MLDGEATASAYGATLFYFPTEGAVIAQAISDSNGIAIMLKPNEVIEAVVASLITNAPERDK
jgi:hypothetical protein